MKEPQPKQLNLDEAWKVYKIARSLFIDRLEKDSQIDLSSIISGLSKDILHESITIMYDKVPDDPSGIFHVNMFLVGILHNNIFQFSRIMKELSDAYIR